MSDNAEARMTTDDPALVALNKMASLLEPFDRAAQLRILAAVSVLHGHYDYARAFISVLEKEARR